MIYRYLFEQIVNSINFRESATILGFKDDGLYELIERFSLDSQAQLELQEQLRHDVTIRKLEIRFIEKMLSSDTDKSLLEFLGFSATEPEALKHLLNEGTRLVFIVEEIERINSPTKTLDMFDQLIKQYRDQISFIYLLEDVKTFIMLQASLEPSSSFFENTILQPLEGEQEKESLEELCEHKYGEIGNKQKLKQIFEQSHGHFHLYKRLYKTEITGNKETLENYARRLTNSFGKQELKVFRKLINGVPLSEKEEEIIRIYRELGFIKRSDITIPILKKYILDLSPKEEILYNKEDGQIIFDNIQLFTKTEISLLRMFLENQEEVVSKDELATVIWGDKVAEKYSPWAIDQTIFRLRLKLDKLNLNGEVQTIHGKGYVFQKGK